MVHRGRRAWRIIGLLVSFCGLGSGKDGGGRHRMQWGMGSGGWIFVQVIVWRRDRRVS
jgi:hypothetical protein